MVILFKDSKARMQLFSKGVAYTLRGKKRRTGHDVVRTSVRGRSLGRVYIEYIGKVDPDRCIVFGRMGDVHNLEDFVMNSGFDTVSEWLEHAVKLNGSGELYLYRVTLLRRSV